MNNTIVIRNREPQEITISGGGEVYGITTVYVNGIDVTDGSVAYVIVPTKTSELTNDSGFITQETDPTVPYYIKQITQADISNWNNKQASLVSGVNIKTINGNSVLGSGNMNIDTSYTAGTGIEITNQNVINNTVTSYNDLENLPIIPSYTSQLVNDSNFVVSSQLSNVAFSGSYIDLSNTPEIPAFTSELTNDGEDGDNPFISNKTNSLENYYNKEFMWNMLPKLTDSDTIINLTPTVLNAPMRIELGASELTQDGTPTPSSPQDIHTISGSNKVVVCGKNLFDYVSNLNSNVAGLTSTINADGSITTTGKPTYGYANIIHVDITNLLVNGQTYTISMGQAQVRKLYLQINIIDNGGGATQYVSLNTSSSASFTANTTGKTYWLNLQTDSTTNWGDSSLTITNTYQLEKGSPATAFSPYVSQEADIDLGEIEYCKIGNYEDKVIRSNDGTWQLEKNIDKELLDGTESNWTLYTSYNNEKFVYSHWNTKYGLGFGTSLCTRFKNRNYAWADYGNIGEYSDHTSQTTKFFVTDQSSLENWKTWLSNNNVTLYYVLAKPTYTPITGTLAEQLEEIYNELTAYDEQTNISQINNDLPFVITATTLKSLINV